MLLPPVTWLSILWLPPSRGAAIETLQWRVVCDLVGLFCRSVRVDCFLIVPTPLWSRPSARCDRARGKESPPRSAACRRRVAECAGQRHIHALVLTKVPLAPASQACPAAVPTSVSQVGLSPL